MLSSDQRDFSALFTEVPSNPLLRTPDVQKLRQLSNEHNLTMVVDDTIGNFANVHMLRNEEGADVVCTSLTKLFSGRGDAMAGSLVCNPHTQTGQQIQNILEESTSDLFSADAWAMWHNSEDFLERNERINETSERLCDWLKQHKDVETIYYPKYTNNYAQVATGVGHGGLFSLLLGGHVCKRTFFDTLDISKGPSLGTNFTLMCPYTLLAHYHELDFAMAYDVQPDLLRVTVGLEDFTALQKKFEAAFEKSRLHPPVPKLQARIQQQKRAFSTMATVRRGIHLGRRLFK